MKRNKSPCIDICKFIGKNSWCIGCGRTREECKKWKHMKPYAITKLRRDLGKRMTFKWRRKWIVHLKRFL